MMSTPFALVSYGITAAIILWISSDPEENTKMFLSIPSIAILMFSYIVLGTSWAEFGAMMENLRIFFAGMVAIPYVTASGYAYLLRVYAYMWSKTMKKQKRSKRNNELTIEKLLGKK